jgi:hypothetical protein
MHLLLIGTFFLLKTLYLKVFDINGKDIYKYYFEQTLDNVIYVKPWFVTLVESNVKQPKVNPCEQ